ncbi:MAG: ribonuclease R [Chitinophagales bacterium]
MNKKKKFIPKSKKSNGKKKKSGGKSGGLDEKVIKYLNTKNKSGVKPDQLYTYFLKKYQEDKITASLKRMMDRKKVELTESGKIKVVRFFQSQDKFITGILDVASSGVGYVKTAEYEKDIFIPRKEMLNALKGDRVEIEMTKFSVRKPEGKIVNVVERNQHEFLGKFEEGSGFAFAIPFDKSIPFDVYIPEKYYAGAKDGDKIRVEVLTWKDKGKNPIGRVTQLLNNFNHNEIEMQSILLENGFRLNFPDKVAEELKELKTKITKNEIEKRLDYRDVPTFTIDPKDAKDFDDALSVKQNENGTYEVGVHIADVSHYIRPGSALDKEAEYRATSVYLPDRVLPMLPEKISNELCSLRPNEDKLAFSVLFEVNKKMEITGYQYTKTVIHSDRRFVYEEVQEIIEGADGDFKEEINYLTELARSLRKKRIKKGSINFDSDEVRFKLDENAKPVEVYIKKTIEANLLVEDFMLLANIAVAKYLSKIKVTKGPRPAAPYRVHDKPSEEKLQILTNIAKQFGHNLRFDDPEQTREALQNLMQKIEGKPEMNILSTLAIRSMAKAVYTTKNIGHYGLAFDFYTHFTSPIRRYPDVLVHRLLANQVHKEKNFYDKEELEEILQQASIMEKKAQQSERSAIKYKQVEYIKDFIGETFEGVISGVINKGFFVELVENKCEGFVPLYQLDEEFIFQEEVMQLKGSRTGVIYQIGATVNVTVEEANIAEKRIEFAVADS